MTPQDGVWVCPNGHEKVQDSEEEKSMITIEDQESSEIVDISDVDNVNIGPTTKVICPKCDHDVTCYETKQTRLADESETRFFTHVECDHR